MYLCSVPMIRFFKKMKKIKTVNQAKFYTLDFTGQLNCQGKAMSHDFIPFERKIKLESIHDIMTVHNLHSLPGHSDSSLLVRSGDGSWLPLGGRRTSWHDEPLTILFAHTFCSSCKHDEQELGRVDEQDRVEMLDWQFKCIVLIVRQRGNP